MDFQIIDGGNQDIIEIDDDVPLSDNVGKLRVHHPLEDSGRIF